MSLKCFLSEASVDLFREAFEEQEVWHFKSVNSMVLLSSLIEITDSTLKEYLLSEGAEEDDIANVISLNFSTKVAQLKDKKKGKEKEEEKQGKKEQDKKEDSKQEDSKQDDNNKDEGKKDDVKKEMDPKKVVEDVFGYKPDHDADIRINDFSGKEWVIPVSASVSKVFACVSEMCSKNMVEKIEPVFFVAAMFEAQDETLRLFFKDLVLSFTKARRYYTNKAVFTGGAIPYRLSGFMTNLNEKVDISKPCEILGRDKEINQIWNISLKSNKRNTVIVGEAGVGKSALIDKITYDIAAGNCPERFLNFNVIALDVNSLIAGTSYRGDAEERIKDVINYLKLHDNVILFIDEVHTILGAGSCFEGEMDLANALKPILARGETIVIGATTENEYNAYFAQDAALSRRFEKVVVTEPLSKDVYPMIKNKIKGLTAHHKVRITRQMVEYAILISNCFAFEKKNPDKTLDLIDRSMVTAYRTGKKYVDKESILGNFDIYYDLFKGMGEEDKKVVAYHEAGHYIVGKASGRLVNYNFLAVSIMPAEDYLGVTVYEPLRDRLPFSNLDYFIDLIAFDLGGRVAQNIFRGDFTSGAGADLYNATQVALNVVSKLGMTVDVDKKRNNVFINTPDYPMFTEKIANLINDEVQELINRAYKRAEEILTEHRMLLEMIVNELLRKQIVSENELERVWQRYLKKKSRSLKPESK